MASASTQANLVNQDQPPPPPPPPRRPKPDALINHQPPPAQKCPRCDSSNTKFCYYNNYSLTQPRYFCKGCRRYWTQGGSLRNVPVGGGCRKTKRPKPSASETNEIARSQSMVNPGQGLRAPMPPVINPPIANSFFAAAGTFMSPLAAMPSLASGINQGGAGVTFNATGTARFGANVTLVQGVNIPSMRPNQQFHAQTEIFRTQQSLNIAQRPLNSWTQSFTNRGTTATTQASSSTFWVGATTACNPGADGDNQAGSTSFNPNQWSDNNPGFGPSQ